jgi:superfamily II DNA or RNA helicase
MKTLPAAEPVVNSKFYTGHTFYDTTIVGHETRRKQIVPALKSNSKVEFKDRFAYQDHIVFGEIFNARYASLNTPTGSGKTYMILAHARNHLKASLINRVIIMTPQKIPASGFQQEREYIREDGTSLGKIVPGLNLIDSFGSKSEALIQFMSPGVNKLLKNNIALCTHSTFVKAFTDNSDVFRNCLLVVDEAHHSSYNDSTLGDIINGALTDMHKNCHLLMVSATMYRSDGSLLFKPEYRSYFKTAFRSFHDHLVSVDIQDVHQEIILTPTDAYEKSLSEIIANRNYNPVIYLPGDAVNEKKHTYLNKVYKSIGGQRRKTFVSFNVNGTKYKTYVQRFTHTDGVIEDWIELVDDDAAALRDAKKYLIEAANDEQYAIRGIISNRMFGEGGDLRHLNCVIQIGFNSSLQRSQQRNGRATRYSPGKNAVAFYTIVSGQIKGQENRNELNSKINNLHKIMAYAQMTQDLMQPIDLILEKAPKEIADDIIDARERGPGILERIFDNNCEREASFRAKVEQECLRQDVKITLDVIKNAVAKVAASQGMQDLPTKDVKAVAMGIWLRQVINRLKFIEPHLDMSKITFDMAQAVDCGDEIQRHFADLTGHTYCELAARVREFDCQECEATIKEIAEFFVKNSCYPKQYKTNCRENYLANWIQEKKRAMRGIGDYRWIGIEPELANKYNISDVFKFLTLEEKMIVKIEKCCQKMKNTNWEFGNLNFPRLIVVLRRARKDFLDNTAQTTTKWQNIYGLAFAKNGFPEICEPNFIKKQSEALASKKLNEIFVDLKITGRKPSSSEYNFIRKYYFLYHSLQSKIEENGFFPKSRTDKNIQHEKDNWSKFEDVKKYFIQHKKKPPYGTPLGNWVKEILDNKLYPDIAKALSELGITKKRGAEYHWSYAHKLHTHMKSNNGDLPLSNTKLFIWRASFFQQSKNKHPEITEFLIKIGAGPRWGKNAKTS